jgi:anthranilate/para-aminobenzoate synthase component I
MGGDEAPLALFRLNGERFVLFHGRRNAVIHAATAASVAGALSRVQQALDKGRTVVLVLGYELGAALARPPMTPGHKPHALMPRPPLIWAFPASGHRVLSPAGLRAVFARTAGRGQRRGPLAREGGLRPLMGKNAYARMVRRIQSLIAAGDVYQINATFPCVYHTAQSPEQLFLAMLAAQPAPHAAWLRMAAADGRAPLWVVSASPELFLRLGEGRLAVTRR